MLRAVDDLAGKSVRFTSPVQVVKHKIDIVYVALDSKPLLVESPRLSVKKSPAQDQSLSMTLSMKDNGLSRLLEQVDSLIKKDAQKHRQGYKIQSSVEHDEFRAKILVSARGVETRFFLSNKKEAEPNIESKTVNKILQDACVRLICRLDGYTIDSSKDLVKPLWVVQQCLVSNQNSNPVGTKYCFLDDGDDLSYISE